MKQAARTAATPSTPPTSDCSVIPFPYQSSPCVGLEKYLQNAPLWTPASHFSHLFASPMIRERKGTTRQAPDSPQALSVSCETFFRRFQENFPLPAKPFFTSKSCSPEWPYLPGHTACRSWIRPRLMLSPRQNLPACLSISMPCLQAFQRAVMEPVYGPVMPAHAGLRIISRKSLG